MLPVMPRVGTAFRIRLVSKNRGDEANPCVVQGPFGVSPIMVVFREAARIAKCSILDLAIKHNGRLYARDVLMKAEASMNKDALEIAGMLARKDEVDVVQTQQADVKRITFSVGGKFKLQMPASSPMRSVLVACGTVLNTDATKIAVMMMRTRRIFTIATPASNTLGTLGLCDNECLGLVPLVDDDGRTTLEDARVRVPIHTRPDVTEAAMKRQKQVWRYGTVTHVADAMYGDANASMLQDGVRITFDDSLTTTDPMPLHMLSLVSDDKVTHA
jgi:hypothetical protein